MTSDQNKSYFVVPLVTDLNRGDQALVWESVKVIKEAIPNSDVNLFESGSTPEQIALQTRQTVSRGYRVLPRILGHPSRVTLKYRRERISYGLLTHGVWGIVALFDLLVTLTILSRIPLLRQFGRAALSSEQRKSLFLFSQSDGVFVKGGGFVHAYGKWTDWYTLYYLLFYIFLANSYRIPVFVLPNSIGPVTGRVSRWIVRRALAPAKIVTVREPISQAVVSELLGLQSTPYPDLGFFAEGNGKDFAPYLRKRGVPLADKPVVCITVRPYRFPGSSDPDERYQNYIEAIADLTKRLCGRDMHVVFYAHTLGPSAHEDDRVAIRDVLFRLDPDIARGVTCIDDCGHTCEDVIDLYAACDLVIGTRFHSVIFSLNAGVPALAIAYGGNKSTGIMGDMGLGRYVIPIESVDSTAMEGLVVEIIQTRDRYLETWDAYRRRIAIERRQLVRALHVSAESVSDE